MRAWRISRRIGASRLAGEALLDRGGMVTMRLGVDIGGTKTDAVIVDDAGRVQHRYVRPSGFGAEVVLGNVAAAVAETCAAAAASNPRTRIRSASACRVPCSTEWSPMPRTSASPAWISPTNSRSAVGSAADGRQRRQRGRGRGVDHRGRGPRFNRPAEPRHRTGSRSHPRRKDSGAVREARWARSG